MNRQTEIPYFDLPGAARKVLDKCAPLVKHYKSRGYGSCISLYPDDYRTLSQALQDAGIDINRATFDGFQFKKADI